MEKDIESKIWKDWSADCEDIEIRLIRSAVV